MLNATASIIIASVDRNGRPVAKDIRDDQIDIVARYMVAMFGGCTRTDGVGYWSSDETGMIRESVAILTSYGTADDVQDNASKVRDLAIACVGILNQDAVAYTIDGTMAFVGRADVPSWRHAIA